MRAIVGLGNPGPEYARTRHNAGFVLADALAERWGLTFRREGRVRGAGGTTEDGTAILLLKPQTYMNRSGTVLAPLLDDPGLDVRTDLLVLVDEYQLPLGRFRIRPSGSAGGHNGLKSVEGALRSQEYARLRIGIGPVPPEVDDRADWVLEAFTPDEWDALHALVPTMADAVECWAHDGIDEAMNRFNQPRTTE